MTEPDLHCGNDCRGRREFILDELADELIEVPANDPRPDECVHCSCCCLCLGCEYGPRDGMGLTEEQRAPIAAMALDLADGKPLDGRRG